MKSDILRAWRLPLVIFTLICIAVIGFTGYQVWTKGRLPDPELLDLQFARDIQENTHRTALQPQIDEPYHYDFFTLLEQPVPDRALPDLELAQNPALRAKARGGINRLSGKFAIQVSSFKNAGDAQTLVHQLNVQGYHAIVVAESVNGQGWYRVRVDGGAKREQAENLQANIEKRTGLKGFVVAL